MLSRVSEREEFLHAAPDRANNDMYPSLGLIGAAEATWAKFDAREVWART